MPGYNVFNEAIDERVRDKHDALMAQTKALFDVSNLLNEAMNSLSLPQKELAKLIGVSKGYVSRLLSGTENISLKNLAKILYELGYELNLSTSKIVSKDKENIVWIDFGKTDYPVQMECSVNESVSPWSETYIQKVI